MLTKLLKYDFKSLAKLLIPIYGIALLLALLTRVANLLSDKFSIFSVPSGFISVIFVIVLIGIPIVTFIFTILIFYRNLIKDEGYLMHTIPVSKHNIILSKTISSTSYLILSGIFVILLLFIGVYNIWFDSKVLKFLGDALSHVDTIFLILIIISIIISVILNQLMFYASISLGQKHNSKILYSIIYGVVLYNVTQILSVIILLPFMLLDSNYQQYISGNNVFDFSLINGFIGLSLVVSVLFIIGYYFITVKVLDKNLNLE